MPAAEKTETVEVEDEGVVTIDIGDLDLAEPVAEATPEPAPKKAAAQAKPAATAVPDEATTALNQAIQTAEAARKAAEATAQAERQAREAAQRLAQQREQEAAGYREQAESGQLALITTGIEKATQNIEQAQAAIERAQEAGDFKASAAAQVQLSKASAALDRLEAEKAAFDAGARRTPPQTAEGRVEAPQAAPFEQYVSGFQPRAQNWLRTHPECVPAQVGGNPAKNAAMMRGHWSALEKGIPEGSDDYYRVIEEATGYRTPVADPAVASAAAEVTPAETPAAKPAPRRAPLPSAPVARDAPGPGTTPGKRSVNLTPQQQEIARLSFPQNAGESEVAWRKRANATYAYNLLAAEAEGKIGRLTH